MSYDLPVPPSPEPPPPPPEHVHLVTVQPDLLLPPVHQAPPARPARGYEAANVLYPGLVPPGVTTYRLKGTETTRVE